MRVRLALQHTLNKDGDSMQDRYAGDIGDYGKMALLKALQAQGMSVGVNWYKVEALDIEKKSDGSFKQEDGKYSIRTGEGRDLIRCNIL